jgi:protease-4
MNINNRWLAFAIIFLCFIAIPISIIGSGKARSLQPQDDNSSDTAWSEYIDSDHIAVIRLTGLIAEEADGDGFLSSGNTSGAVLKQLRKAVQNKHVKGVLLRIDSPGGTVSTSQEIADEIKILRDKQKAVVVSMGDVSASGGYYVACGADKIVADPGTITGSIGVIFHTMNFKGLADKFGVQAQVVKSGPFKDIGSPYRQMTPEEKAILQNLISDAYDQFVTAISNGRHMPIETVRKLADGRIYSGRQALKLGLIDKLGSYTVALNLIQDMCKERFHKTGDLPIKEAKPKNFLSSILESTVAPFNFHALGSLDTNHAAIDALMPEFIKAKYSHQPLWLMP